MTSHRDKPWDCFQVGGATVVDQELWRVGDILSMFLYFAVPSPKNPETVVLTDSENIAPDPRKIHSYQQGGPSGTPPIGAEGMMK